MQPHRASQLNPNLQYRCFDVRALNDEADGFDGHASTFWAVDSYATAMAPGAFKHTLKRKGDKRIVLWQHDSYTPIGKTTALKEDKTGLAFSAAISTGTSAGGAAMTLLRDEVPLGMSFGFRTLKKRSAEDDDPLDFSQMPSLKRDQVEIITDLDLWEVSLVSFPANEAATISAVRSDMELDALTSLMDAIKGGDLDEGRAVLVQQIVDAWGQWAATAAAERNAADQQNATPEQARRNRYREYCFLTASLGLPVEL